MGLKQVGLNVDEQKWEALGKGRGQIVRDLINSYLAYKDKDTKKIDEEILRRKLYTLETKKIKVDTEIESIKSTLNRVKEDRDNAEMEKLQQEKEEAEAAIKCLSCSQILDEKVNKKKFNKGLVCMPCFLKADGTKIREWS